MKPDETDPRVLRLMALGVPHDVAEDIVWAGVTERTIVLNGGENGNE